MVKKFIKAHQPDTSIPLTCPKELRAKLSEQINAHKKLVHHIVNKYKYTGVSEADLFMEGLIGLFTSIQKFDPSKKVSFSTYAYYWIRGKILRYLHTVKKPSNNMDIVSYENPICIDGYFNHSTSDVLYHHEEEDHNQEYEKILRIVISLLDQNMKTIAVERLFTNEPKTLKELGNMMGMSGESARRLEKKTIETIRNIIQTLGLKLNGYISTIDCCVICLMLLFHIKIIERI